MLPVPFLDESLRTAVRNLNATASQFREWADEAQGARESLFTVASAKEARLQLFTTGRLTRQRYEAAWLAGDFRYRIRTQYPHPIAFRWRTVETAVPDLEGYVQVLECAEVTLCYLAIVAMTMAHAAEVPIHYVEDMAARLSNGNGTNLGDWAAILREVCTAKAFRKINDSTPFYEVTRMLAGDSNDLLQRILDRRNDQAHSRGPKGEDSVKRQFATAVTDLEALLQASEFLTEYPLYYVEQTWVDTLTSINTYGYRLLVGDHPLVPLRSAQATTFALEAHSLYMVDRSGKLHLLRPLLVRQRCPSCGAWATYYLDRYEKSSAQCVLKPMEHGHDADAPSLYDSAAVQAFRAVGFLK